MKYLLEKDVQCFFTTTEKIEIDATFFCIKNGKIVNGGESEIIAKR